MSPGGVSSMARVRVWDRVRARVWDRARVEVRVG